jgi:ribose/xylose/arabinose/galactoside ABC-type transport system permease subunit
MLSFGRGVAFWYTNANSIIWSSLPGASTMSFIGGGKIAGIPVLGYIWLVIVILTFIMLKYTVAGRIVYSIGGNEQSVKYSGINITRWKMFPYIFSGLMCGIGGILLTARLGVGAPTSGEGLELDCIAAVVIGGASFNGGVGNVSGTVIGVIILGIINNILDLMNVPQYPQLMLKGAIIVVAVIFSSIRER